MTLLASSALQKSNLHDVSGPSTNAEYVARQEARESNARTYARRLRIAVTRAKGVTLTDADGKTYFDCLAAAGTLALGHNHPAIVSALKTALDQDMLFQSLDIATPVKDAFTDALLGTLPPAFAARARIQFCSPAGTDAIEAAIKLVKTAKQKSGLFAFSGAYHGMSQSVMGMMGNLGPRQNLAGHTQTAQFLPYPHSYRCPFGVGGDQTEILSTSYVRSLLEDPESGVLPAAMVLEIVQGEGGVIPAPDQWTRAMRELTSTHAVPLVVDEVQTGWGRTGALYAFGHSGITPDVLVLSKAIGGGLPMAVIIYDKSLDLWQPGAHAGTFRGNTLAMVAGMATLQVIQEESLAQHAALMGQRLLSHLRAAQADLPILGDVRGRGLMVGVEIVDTQDQPDALGHYPADAIAARQIRQACQDRGLILEMGGRHSAVARFLPPLIITADQIDTVASIFVDACRSVMKAAV